MRLIDERELIRRISELPDLRTINTGTIGKIIKECITIDAEPVVRCKDCKHYNGHRWCLYFADSVQDDDYCSYGAKMDKEGQR